MLLIIGCFLPWAKVDVEGAELFVELGAITNLEPSGVDDITGEVDVTAVIFIFLGIVAGVIGLLAVVGVVRLVLKVIAITLLTLNALLALLILVFVLTDEFISIEGTTEGIPTTLGIGTVLVVVGAIAAVLGSLLLKRRAPAP
jgi:hypothetical protein